MGIAERREREKEQLRTRIVEAARDILSESGLEGLSMREIARRIEYSPATIYLYFQNKDELIKAVVVEGFRLLGAYAREEMERVGPEATASERYWGSGRGYVRFALENTAYFHVIFDLPMAAAWEDCPQPAEGETSITEERTFERVVMLLEQATREGTFKLEDAERAAVVGWAMLHGVMSLYLSGHLREVAPSREDLDALVDWAMATVGTAWRTGVTMPPVAARNGSAGGGAGEPATLAESGAESES